MNAGPCYAIFLMGGAANGKTTALQTCFRLAPRHEDDPDWNDGEARPLVSRSRRLDPDDFKQLVPMFTMAVDDARARAELGPGLGGPSGPLDRAEYDRYPPAVRRRVEALVAENGFGDLATFANEWLPEQNPNGEGSNFGGGLTHELSKALAQRHLRRFLAEDPPAGSFVWDAIGNGPAYRDWIEQALEAGYRVRVLYVQAPLPVAQMWAHGRERKLAPKTISDTYWKAAEAAREIREFVRSLGGNSERLSFQRILRGEDRLGEAYARGFTDYGLELTKN